MAIKEFLDSSMFSDPTSALDLVDNSVRRSMDFNVYGRKTIFQALVLTRPIFLADVTTEGTTTVFGHASRDTGKLTKFAFKGRIIDAPSPHDYLPNPCDAAATTDAEKRGARRLVSLHTTFISSDDYTKSDNYLPEVGDIVLVELKKNVFSYDLQFGTFMSVKDNRVNVEASDEDALDCSSVKDLFADVGAGSTRSRTGTTTGAGYIAPATGPCKDMDGAFMDEEACNWRRLQPATDSAAMNTLLQHISRGEGGYNSMNEGTDWCGAGRICGSTHDSRKRAVGAFLTSKTIQEIMDLQAPGGTRLFAAGKYQIIPGTLIMAVTYAEANYGVSKSDLFDQDTQDKLGLSLLFSNKQPGLGSYLRGENNNIRNGLIGLCQEWASFPHPDTGNSCHPPQNTASHTIAETTAYLRAARRDYAAERAAAEAAAAASASAGGSTP